MLPFDRKPWAPQLAKAVIVFTLLVEIAAFLWLRHYGPLDTPEIVGFLLVLIGVIPPNLHIIRRRPNDRLEDYMVAPHVKRLFPHRTRST